MAMKTDRWVMVAAGGLLVACQAFAQYKSVGPDGRITYSDLPPPPGSKVVDQKKLAPEATANPALPFELQEAATKYPVALYTGDNCAPCDEARAFLRARGVPFTEKTVTSAEDIALFKQQSPDGTAPVLTVGSRKSVGYTQSSWTGLLDSAGYPRTTALPRDYRNPPPTALAPPRADADGTPAGPQAARGGASASASGSPAPAPASAPTSGFRF